MATNRNIFLVFAMLFCVSSVHAQARRFKGDDESPTVTIFLRQNTETQAVDVLVSSTEDLSNTFLEVNSDKVPIQMNKSYSIASLPEHGSIKANQDNGSEILQLAAVRIGNIIWTETASFSGSGGSLGNFGNPSGGGDYVFGTEGGEGGEGGGNGGFGGDFGNVAGNGGEFDPERKGGGRRGEGGRDGFGGEGFNGGGGDCQTLQDSLNSLIQSVNGLVKLNQNLAAENKLLASKVDRIETSMTESNKKEEEPKDTRVSTAKDGVGFSIMPNVSYGQLRGDLIKPDTKGRTYGGVSLINTGLNLGLSFNLSQRTRGHIFAGGGVALVQPQSNGAEEWLTPYPMASLGFGLDLSDKFFVGNNFSLSWKGGNSLDSKVLFGIRKNNAVFGGSVGVLVARTDAFWRLVDTVSFGSFIIVEFGGK